jgi:hypothetical protein
MCQIRISSPSVDRIAAPSRERIGYGVPLMINEPAYADSQLAGKRVDMLAKATADARVRVRAIPSEAGSPA